MSPSLVAHWPITIMPALRYCLEFKAAISAESSCGRRSAKSELDLEPMTLGVPRTIAGDLTTEDGTEWINGGDSTCRVVKNSLPVPGKAIHAQSRSLNA